MLEKHQVYKCEECGNVIAVLNSGGPPLKCCDQRMVLQEEKTSDQGMEKHLPVVETMDKRAKVKVGSVPHPMEQEHYIQWIETVTDEGVSRKYLNPGEAPEKTFCVKEGMTVRAYCNLHGMWSQK